MEQRQPDDEMLPEDEVAPAVEQDNEAESEPVPSADDLAVPASPPAPSRIASMLRGAARVLLAFVFSQYVVVTVLIAVAAVTLSKIASDVLAAKFDAIARAIRHF
jgi:hypothetical protein